MILCLVGRSCEMIESNRFVMFVHEHAFDEIDNCITSGSAVAAHFSIDIRQQNTRFNMRRGLAAAI